MAFLDNSGDIILDAVLTDTGRMRLSKGDGTFKIAKFAFGDDEINYQSYNKDHASGSAYFDLDILQTPILEAFTNNTSTMKSKLLSIPRTNLLYLPVLMLNEQSLLARRDSVATNAKGRFVVTVDERTGRPAMGNDFGDNDRGIMSIDENPEGIMNGFDPTADSDRGVHIRIDQGLDTDEIDPKHRLSSDLTETQYMVEIDNRLGSLVASGGGPGSVAGGVGSMGMPAGSKGDPAAVSFIDDDNIASYFFSHGTDQAFARAMYWPGKANNPGLGQLKGPRGSTFRFRIVASTELQTGNFLFERLGKTGQNWVLPDNAPDTKGPASAAGTATVNYIDSTVRVTGVTTGYRLDIPVRFVKRTA